ncbi:MAG: hypothetical protein Q8M10_12690 [Methylotenera sp.]|uniref:hypothetical protein n=1 Tax=Methylotenera sp. TaxID=2051956 RepID=UPI00272FB101|nr:hypothetical protein [Methylotenera sp.]MDP1524002.1 hypothetical protein [Methylotenera sp.]
MIINLELAKQKNALDIWVEKCINKMRDRFPSVDFYTDIWKLADQSLKNPLQKSSVSNAPKCLQISFISSIKKFQGKDTNFVLCLRCLAFEFIETNKVDFLSISLVYNELSKLPIHTIFSVTDFDFRRIENDLLSKTKLNPIRSESHLRFLRLLEFFIVPKIREAKVIPQLFFRQDPAIKNELIILREKYLSDKSKRRKNSDDRNARIAATSDAISASFNNDPRLNDFDHLVCCALVILFTAPSRINEPLMMSLDDLISIETYKERAEGEMASVYVAQNQLFITMKGSKGADWSPKPALSFMHDLLLLAIERIKNFGKRSRMLLEHYEANPDILYLPKELGYLRQKELWGSEDITRIIRLDWESKYADISRAQNIIDKIFDLKPNGMIKVKLSGHDSYLIPREIVEKYLLEMVKDAIKKCRKHDKQIYYGRLSNRLFLCDVATNQLEFLPNVLRYSTLSRRLIQRQGPKTVVTGSIFTKLGLKVPSGNNIIDAYITTHEARYFLTDAAAKYGDDLSDVLINKWARRLNISQLNHYIKDDPTFDANHSLMPSIESLNEFSEISDAIEQTTIINEEFGVKTDLIRVNETRVLVTQIDAVVKAIEDRPVARVSNKIILLYPSEFGICLHQHHEAPCQNYGVECMGCNDNITIKGHLPSNDAVRNESYKLQKSVINQLEKLVTEYHREIAENQDTFADHIVNLVKGSLNVETLSNQLIDEFEEIKDLIMNMNLRRRLEQAFVAKKTVQFIDDEKTMVGGAIRYRNPYKNGRQGADKVELNFGGWEKHWQEEKEIEDEFPFLKNTRVSELTDTSENFIDDNIDENED